MKEIDRLPSKFGDYDICVASYFSCLIGEELMLMAEIPKDAKGNSLSNITEAYSIKRTGSDEPMHYVRFLKDILGEYAQEGKSILIAGLGGGTIHTELTKISRYLKVQSIEADSTVVALAKKHFGFKGMVTVGKFEDQFMHLGRFDCIIINTFSASSGITTQDFASVDFVRKLEMFLRPGSSIFYAGKPFESVFLNDKFGYSLTVHSEEDEHNGSLHKWTQLKRLI